MKRLSIIIVTYKSEHDIYECLLSIYRNCDIQKEELEIIIVDNSPECGPMFTRLREQYGNDIILIHNTHNGGYGQGNNVGIRKATAPIVMIMNPDVRMIEPVFKTAIKAFEDNLKLCMYGMKQMLSPKVKSPLSFDCSRQINGYLIPIICSLCNKLDIYIAKYMFLQGSCFFIKKESFEQIGLFDEEIFMYGEEYDIHSRLEKRFGAQFIYNKRLHYMHLTLERPMSLETERKMVRSIVLSNKKKGITPSKTLQNFIYFYRTRLLSAYIKKLIGKQHAQEHITILKTIISDLKSNKI